MSDVLKVKLASLRSSISEHRDSLYDALSSVYVFRMEAMASDDADHNEWVRFAVSEYSSLNWNYTKATGNNIFTAALKLAFCTDEAGNDQDAAPISKYAKALASLKAEGVGFEYKDKKLILDTNLLSAAKAVLKKNGIAKLCETKALASQTEQNIDYKAILGRMEPVASLDVNELGDADTEDTEYRFVLARVSDGKVELLETAAHEGEDVVDKFLAQRAMRFAETTSEHGPLIRLLRNSFGISDRMIVIDNSADTAIATVYRPNSMKQITRIELPKIKSMPNETFVFPSVDSYLSKFKQAFLYNWQVEKLSAPRVGRVQTLKDAKGKTQQRPEWGTKSLHASHALTLRSGDHEEKVDLLQAIGHIGHQHLRSEEAHFPLALDFTSSQGQALVEFDRAAKRVADEWRSEARKIGDKKLRSNFIEKNRQDSYCVAVGSAALEVFGSPIRGLDGDTYPQTKGRYDFETKIDLESPFWLNVTSGEISRIVDLIPVGAETTAKIMLSGKSIAIAWKDQGLEITTFLETADANLSVIFRDHAEQDFPKQEMPEFLKGVMAA